MTRPTTNPRSSHSDTALQLGANTNAPFICTNCSQGVGPTHSGGEQRNHCPACLWSLHVDRRTGDRRSGCRSAMEPVALWVRRNGEWSLVHRCDRCGLLRANRIAADDNPFALMSLAARPLALPAFPLDRLAPTGVGAASPNDRNHA